MVFLENRENPCPPKKAKKHFMKLEGLVESFSKIFSSWWCSIFLRNQQMYFSQGFISENVPGSPGKCTLSRVKNTWIFMNQAIEFGMGPMTS